MESRYYHEYLSLTFWETGETEEEEKENRESQIWTHQSLRQKFYSWLWPKFR